MAKRVRDLLTTPSRWTQGAPALDQQGMPCRGDSPLACCWCLGEAILVCYPDPYERVAVTKRVLAHLGLRFGERRQLGHTVHEWNDAFGRTFADVQAVVLATGI